MKNFKEFFIEMSGRALGKASDDFKNRSNDMTQGRMFDYLAGLMKTRNHKQLKKDLNNFISRNIEMKTINVKVLSKHLKPIEVKNLVEDIEITDRTAKALDVAQRYYKTYKNTKRNAPEVIKKGVSKFILKGTDEDLVADILTDKSIDSLKNVNVKARKVK